jgi:integrase
MASIFKRKGDPNWIIAYTSDDGRRVERSSRTVDHRVAERIGNELEARVAERRAGLVDPRAEHFAAQARRPLAEHVGEFIGILTAGGRSPQHVSETMRSIERIHEAMAAQRIGDLTASRVQEAVARLRVEPLPPTKPRKGDGLPERPLTRSARTVNKLLQAETAFVRWLVRDGRLPSDPLLAVSRLNVQVDRKRRRRELTNEEIGKLLEAAENGPEYRGLSGSDRAMLYRLALGTGFRASELASLTPAQFALEGEAPTVSVEACYSKHRKEDVQPIREDLAAALRPWLAKRFRGAPVFATARLEEKTAAMLRFDLERAEVAVADSDGRVADFHALRATFISAVVRSGATVKEAQALARHATPDLTFRVYAHVQRHDLSRVLANMPASTSADPANAQKARKTGTDATDAKTAPPAKSPALAAPRGSDRFRTVPLGIRGRRRDRRTEVHGDCRVKPRRSAQCRSDEWRARQESNLQPSD